MSHPTPAPPPSVIYLAGVRYTTTAPDRALHAALHGPGPFASVAYDQATNTWTLGGHTAAILAALERCGITLDGEGDTQTDEDDGVILAPVPLPDERLREALAALEHARWSRWMEYLFSVGTVHADGTWTMPAEKVARWRRQMHTAYRDLSEPEKDSDRAEADQTRALLGLGNE